MTITKTVTNILSDKTAAASNSTTLTDCTTINTTSAIGLSIIVRATFNASATLGARLKAFGSNDDADWATARPTPYWQVDIPKTSGAIEQSFEFPYGPKYLKFQLTNLDTGQSITAISIDSHVQTA